MVSFEAATAEELATYRGEFDRVMVFEDENDLPLIRLAARAHARYLGSRGEIPSHFYEGVQSLDPQTRSMMMNPSFVNDYSGMLASYAVEAFLYVDYADGADIDEYRSRAHLLDEDIVQGSRAFDMFGTIDLDAVATIPEPAKPVSPQSQVPAPRTPSENGIPAPGPLAMRIWGSPWGRALLYMCGGK